MTREQYAHKVFQDFCRTILQPTMLQLSAFVQAGYRISGVAELDGSPNCGINLICIGYQGGELCPDLVQRQCSDLQMVPGKGVFMEIFRGTPLLIQLFFIYYGLPTINITLTSYQAAIIGLGLNGGAYISEVVRAGLQSIDAGQKDAAYALGLTWFQALVEVILPQAMAVSIPPLMNIFSSLLKETSLVSVLAITELTRVGQLVYTRSFRAFEIYLAIACLYFLMTFVVARVSYFLERRYVIPGRL